MWQARAGCALVVHVARMQNDRVLRARLEPGVLFALFLVAHLTYSVEQVVEIYTHFKGILY
jgi:hypothetical protein